MKIEFRTNKLKKIASDTNYARKELGEKAAKRLLMRLNALCIAETFEDLKSVPGRFHELNYERKGQWGFDLEHPLRLIIEPKSKPIAVDDNGAYIWAEISDAVIIEIVNYHKERKG